jgi:hypothetical protein
MSTFPSRIRITYSADFAMAVRTYLNPLEWTALKQLISYQPEALCASTALSE